MKDSNKSAIVICIALSGILFLAIQCARMVTLPHRYAGKDITINTGETWALNQSSDPFAQPDIRTYKILDVKEGTNGVTYVRYDWIEGFQMQDQSDTAYWFTINKHKTKDAP